MNPNSTQNNRFPFPSSIKIKNYKCFGPDKFVGFDRIKPINILIGKNNSGKSTLIDLVHFVLSSPEEIGNLTDLNPVIECEIITNQKIVDHAILYNPHNSKEKILFNTVPEYIKSRLGSKMTFHKTKSSTDYLTENLTYEIDHHIHEWNLNYHEHFHFIKISAERDIKPEQQKDENLQVSANGVGATQLIHAFLHFHIYHPKIVTINLLQAFNYIVSPDINYEAISTRKLSANENLWEVYFEDKHGNLIPLSKMGSGIKTILMVLITLFISPKLNQNKNKTIVYAFEELENNLHPSMLRKLINYLVEYQKKNHTYFFITTHSNVLIDIFTNREDSQVLLVDYKSENKVKLIEDIQGQYEILDSLGTKASDILQANGIIWVEGISDVNYLRKWIQLKAPELIEGLHFTFMFYGGKNLANVSLKADHINTHLIPLLSLIKNAFVIIDRDSKSHINTKISATKKRIQAEIGEKNCWITQGREIENYIPVEVLSQWIPKANSILTFDKYDKIEEILPARFPKYANNKNKYSREIVNHVEIKHLDVLDLNAQLDQLLSAIKLWNE